jgi:hypothetical protein
MARKKAAFHPEVSEADEKLKDSCMGKSSQRWKQIQICVLSIRSE